ncbi:hypothetical protein KC19_7G043100 [Ceratodon purpureus]|uniref:Uncharacterized protein n=1 Tax=Ceratodon purpureus TaxID=3225 RepID=A0A8T0HAM1_CERPU|nr:hypothetical protein KC19_7G043100 [Ceratodon purpureus]
MYGDGEPSENPLEPEGRDQASTSGSSGEALSKQSHDNPVYLGNATASTSGEQQQTPDVRDGDARANFSPEGPTSTAFQNDAGWVPLVLSPAMFPGNPDSWIGAPGTIPSGTTPLETFPSGAVPLGTFPPGTTPPATVDGITIPQWMPVLIPVQMPLFLPSPPSDQAGQNAGFYSVPSMIPFYQPFGMAPGAPTGLKFPVPMNVPMPTDGNLPGATAGHPVADAGRAPPVVAREGVPPGQVGQMQPNGVPHVAQADQRRVVRRFQVGIQLDLLLLLKLAVVVFVFNQDGSKDRLFLLLGLAGVIYLYQTGSLAPLLRWLAERAQQFMTPPQQLAQAQAQPQPQADGRLAPEVQAREAPGADAANPAAEEPTGEAAEPPAEGANHQPPLLNAQVPQDPFWAFVKEVQMLVVGFVTSLLPGFHPHAD